MAFAFSSEQIGLYGFFGILLGDTIWPVICTWIFTGFVVGTMAKGIGRGLKASLFVFGLMVLLWVVFGVFAGMDLTSVFINNTLQTVSELGFVLIILVLSGIIGGWVSGPYDIL